MKLAFIGLSKVGKTSIVKRFFLSYSLEELQHIKPTIFKEETTTRIQGVDEPVYILDLGGQESYLAKHTDQKNYKDTNLIVFVIDIQDIARIEKTGQYFTSILNMIKNMNEKVLISVLLHKYDPEVREKMKENLVQYYQFINKTFENINPIINLTSIYDDSSNRALMRLILKLSYFSVIRMGLECLTTNLLDVSQETQQVDILQYISEKGKDYGLSIRDIWFKRILSGEPDRHSITGNVKFELQTTKDNEITISIYLETLPVSTIYTSAQLTSAFLTGFLKPLYCTASVNLSNENLLILTVSENENI